MAPGNNNNNKKGNRSGKGPRWNNNKKKTNNTNEDKRELKFAPQSATNKGQHATFNTVMKTVVNKLSLSIADFTNDITDSVEDMAYVDLDNATIKPKRNIQPDGITGSESAEEQLKMAQAAATVKVIYCSRR